MKFTTFGIWNAAMEEFFSSVLKDNIEGISEEKLKTIFLSEVITNYININIETSIEMRNKDQLTQLEKTQEGYRRALATILPTLAQKLKVAPYLLESYTQKFIQEHGRITELYLGYFMKFCIPQRAKIELEVKNEWYGETFATVFPELQKELYFNDPEMVDRVTHELSDFITKTIADHNLPDETKQLWMEHIKFIKEVSSQLSSTSADYKQLFMEKTGKTMAEFKEWNKLSVTQNLHQTVEQTASFASIMSSHTMGSPVFSTPPLKNTTLDAPPVIGQNFNTL